MEHALIIGGDRTSIDILEHNLWDAGYRSIIAVRDADEANTVVRYCRPSLIILVPEQAIQSTEALRDLSECTGAPIIVATADPAAALRCLGPEATLDGPYAAEDIARVEAAARQPARFARAA
ncbi:hypothetical protein HY78_08245 [Rhizorhabdus wittichii DC-6]|nr:hypothetical protein HY78_08245 [Rhizorhabdus wittichii DC-6]